MTEQPSPYPVPTQPAPSSAPPAAPAAVATTETPAPGRTKRWLAGAMLVTVGLVAGSGTTYAFTSNPTSELPGSVSGYGRGAGPLGAPRDGAGPAEGTQPDQETGSTDQGTASADGEPT